MIMPVRHPVKAAGTVAETDLGDVPRVLQKAKAVVNGRKTYRRKQFLGPRKDLICRQVLARVANHPQYNLTLTR